jgi:hypothetical protein
MDEVPHGVNCTTSYRVSGLPSGSKQDRVMSSYRFCEEVGFRSGQWF